MPLQERRLYTVVGLYADNHQRYADTFAAANPREAEEIASQQLAADNGVELLVAAVIEGAPAVLS